jgi:GDP-L-fucose synthase
LVDRDNDIVNIGAGEEFAIRYFADVICDEVGYDPRAIQYDTTRYVGARSKCLRTDKLRELVPGYEMTPLEEGLRRTVRAFESQHSEELGRMAAR